MDQIKIRPAAASCNATLGEFLLKYDDLRAEEDLDAALREFLVSTWLRQTWQDGTASR